MTIWKQAVAVVALVALAACGGEPEPVTVPDVADLALPDARDRLTDAGLEVDEVDASGSGRGVFSPGNWTVVGQDPAGGATVEPGATVVVDIANVRDDDEAALEDSDGDDGTITEETETAPDEVDEEESQEDEPRGGSLEADVSAGATGLQIVTEVDVHDCKVDLNAGIIRSGYTAEVYMLTAGEPYVVPWDDLTNRDGERFNYSTHRPEMVTISCLDENDRHLVDTWSW